MHSFTIQQYTVVTFQTSSDALIGVSHVLSQTQICFQVESCKCSSHFWTTKLGFPGSITVCQLRIF